MYEVEGDTLQCSNPQCGKLLRKSPPSVVAFTVRQRAFLKAAGLLVRADRALAVLAAGRTLTAADQCPKCGAALERRCHTVDIAANDLFGGCSCEYFQFTVAKALRRGEDPDRCAHIEHARDYALDLSLKAHELRQKTTNRKRQ